jgi:hypothetical protein
MAPTARIYFEADVQIVESDVSRPEDVPESIGDVQILGHSL